MLFVAGLVVTWLAVTRVIYTLENYRPGYTDCDDCGVTIFLDNVGWLVLALGGYVIVAGIGWWKLSSRRR